MYTFIHLYDICNICYLSLMLWYALVLFLYLEIIHWACGCSTSPFISFPQGVNAIGRLQSCILLWNSIRLCICTLDLKNASVELCNSFLSVNVILGNKCYVLHLIQVALLLIWCMLGCVLRACDPLSYVLQCVAVELLKCTNMSCVLFLQVYL